MFHRPLTLLQIVQLILFIVDSGCTKHMTGNLKLLCNFVEKFLVQASVVNDKWCLLKITLQAPFLNDKMMSVHISSGLVLHQMTSDHNRSELGIQDHSNEPSSSKLVPKSCSLSNQDSYITTRVGIIIPPSHSNAEDNRWYRLGINPMIQPEPEDLPKDNPKLEIAVLRWQSAPASEY
ncbi:hypothetical protein Tco_1218417 [Tanacetum coccineum]